MLKTPLPRHGCFNATHPSTAWQEVSCVTVPPVPNIPARGPPPTNLVGSGTDFLARTTSNPITRIEGFFPVVSGVTSESDSSRGTDSFAFQINTNFLRTSLTQALCQSGTTPANCSGWQQFIYQGNVNTNFVNAIYIQYWLVNYGADAAHACPAGWMTSAEGDCYRNSPSNTGIGRMSAGSAMANLRLNGWFDQGGGAAGRADDVVFAVLSSGQQISAGSFQTVFGPGASWTSGEFNVFGNCCGSQANFNNGASVTVQLNTYQGFYPFSPLASNCTQVGSGFTGETSNFRLGSCSSSIIGISFTEATCTVATSCAAQGANCGTIPDGCGGTINCGSCSSPQTCGGGGVANQCGCTPNAVCTNRCANIPDGCGGLVNCGGCAGGMSCISTFCGCPAGTMFCDPGCFRNCP
jgi:hypothetical protein